MLAILINSDWGQNKLARIVTARLSKELQTKINIEHISFSLLNKMNLEGFLLEDRNNDTILSAGKLQVRITDWFIFKDKVELKYINLENAIIKLQRSDSVWNYKFLADYFSSPASTSSKKKGSFEINFKEIELRNIYLLQKDGWRGEDMAVRFASLDMDADDINFDTRNIDISLLEINKPAFSIYGYVGNRPDSLRKKTITRDNLAADDSALKWNAAGWVMNVKRLKITGGIFRNDVHTERAPLDYFDGRHIEFANINAEFQNFKWFKDTITTHLVLTTKERSGFEVKSMKAEAKMTPHEMTFDKLLIKTGRSEIKDYFSMRYDQFSDMSDFINKISMQANFDDVQIDSDDIAYFAPEMKSWEKKIKVNGKARGTVNDLTGRGIRIEAGNNSYLSGDITLSGLPDIDETFIDFKANDFRTTYADAVRFVPRIKEIKEVQLQKINYLHFNGSFTGFIRDFVTFGTIQTNLGTIRSDLNMKLPAGNEPIYSGKIATSNFQLGSLLGDGNLGIISFDGDVEGRSFNSNKIRANLDGKIKSVYYNGYTYRNIEAKGKLNKKLFDGFVSVNDSNAVLSLNGLIDFNDKSPKFNLNADVKQVNLQKLQLSGDDLSFNGKFYLNFSGNSIDDFLGNARVTEAAFFKEGKQLSFDSLVVSSEYVGGIKTLTAQSNELDATLKGEFSVEDIDKTVQLFLHRYYPAYIGATKYQSKNESFSFDIRTRNIEEYIKILDKNLTGFNNSNITGTVDLVRNRLNLVADVPEFAYKTYSFSNSKLTGIGDFDSLVVYSTSNNITINDSLHLPMAEARIVAHNDTSYIQVTTNANKALDKANINATFLTFSNGFTVRFDTSSFVLNGKKWTIEKDGELIFRDNIVASGEVLLRESNQEIKLETKPSAEGHWNDLEVKLSNVNVGDFSPFFLKRERLEGLLSGNINVEDPYNRFYVTSDLEGSEIRLDNDSLGKLYIHNITYDNRTGELKGKARNTDPEHLLNADISLFLKDSLRAKDNRISIGAKNYPIKILDRFLGSLFTDLEGYATTNLDITGDFSNLNYTGKASLHNAGMKVKFTQCFYKIDDGEVELKPNVIDFKNLKIRDAAGASATIERGTIQHESFRNMFFDIQVKTDKEPMELLNTTYNDNQSFYGKAKGTGSFFLSGPESDMIMEVYAKASETDSAYITIPSTTSRETGIADFLVEKKYGRELSDSEIGSSESKMTYDVELTANRMVNIRMILDELTGDEIKARGAGTLKIHAGTAEDLSLRGRYNIEQGNYLFTFQSFFKKPLVVKPGGNNYIDWNGDPMNATVRLEAQYTAENVSFAPLVVGQFGEQKISKARGDVFVIATLTGPLFKPVIGFGLDFPSGSAGAGDPMIDFQKQQIEKNPNELYKQVTYLIVFNSFAPLESQGGGASNTGISLGETATNTLSGIFFNVINNEFNKILNKILKSDKYHVNISNTVYNRNFIDPGNSTALNLGNNLSVSVGRSFFDDRFILTFGGGIDASLGGQSNIQQNVQLLPDVTAEWLINQAGTIRAVFFYRENTDYLNTTSSGTIGRTKRSGASLSYRKEFNTLGGSDDTKKRRSRAQLKPEANKPGENKQKSKED